MKKTVLNILKALVIPVAVYLIFLISSFDRFGTFNAFYAILAQSVTPALLGFGVAYSFMSGILDFTVLFDNQGSGFQFSGINGFFDGKGDFPGISLVNGVDRLNL